MGVGFLLLWLVIRSVKFVVVHMNAAELVVLFQKTKQWIVIVCPPRPPPLQWPSLLFKPSSKNLSFQQGSKCAVLLFFWIGVIPLMIGLLFELLVVIPLRVPINESPARSPLYQVRFACHIFTT